MKLKADRMEGMNAVSRHGAAGVIVNGVEHRRSVIVPWQGAVIEWPVNDFSELSERHFAMLAKGSPELVIFGSGQRIRFPRPAWLRPLMERRIGIETMDTGAASRTYNVLLAEGRAVVLALLFEPTADPPAAS